MSFNPSDYESQSNGTNGDDERAHYKHQQIFTVVPIDKEAPSSDKYVWVSGLYALS